MKYIKKSLIAVLVLGLTACATTSPTTLSAPPADKAQIIFLSPGGVLGVQNFASLYEIRGNERKLLGTMGVNSKMVQNVAPGKLYFMSQLTSRGHLMEAEVEAGKRYYVLLKFLIGSGFQLRPIRNAGQGYVISDAKIALWNKNAIFVQETFEGESWQAKYRSLTDGAQQEAFAAWQKRTQSQRAELTLNKEDAVAY